MTKAPTFPTATTGPSASPKTSKPTQKQSPHDGAFSSPKDERKAPFWRESCYARDSFPLGPKQAKKYGRDETWTIKDVIAEMLRVHGHCNHIKSPRPPEAVWGLTPSEVWQLEVDLDLAADKVYGPELRRNGMVMCRQKRTTPTLLVAVASYPVAGEGDTPERRKWVGLVIKACKKRWGDRFVSAIGHDDEAHYHLHLIAHNSGCSVKPLHAGHATTMDQRNRDAFPLGDVYRAGASAAQAWYRKLVGDVMGWVKHAPRPRVSRKEWMELEKKKIQEEADARIEEHRRRMQLEWEENLRQRLAEERKTIRQEIYEELTAQYRDDTPNELQNLNDEMGQRHMKAPARAHALDPAENARALPPEPIESAKPRKLQGMFPKRSPFLRR